MGRLRASTEPVKVAPAAVTEVAGPLRASGAPTVANTWSVPLAEPPALVATMR